MLQFKDFARSENLMVKDDDGKTTMIALVYTSDAIHVGMEYNHYLHEWHVLKYINDLSYERVKFNVMELVFNSDNMKELIKNLDKVLKEGFVCEYEVKRIDDKD